MFASVARAQVRSAITEQIVQINSLILQEPTLFDAQQKSVRHQQLEETEAAKMGALAFVWLKHAENVHYQYRQGLYDEGEFLAQREIWRTRFREPAWLDTFKATRSFFSPQFTDDVEKIIEENSG